ncbi:hypothetical protein M413DRAFT_30284 [Hebeloma cylindrosporum]|uniref:Uncharacterized protein n=1 Tax=Hebeloma cylindrosporum TaxID=76867 RepID=A0A0C3C3J4_HEBCY|nr:hypothetical protein M413DRAFT_30284 [Hebeloma cylindrosporum h7]
MFSIETTLKYLTLFVVPHPKFSVPLSEADPVYRVHQRTADHDVSYVSQNPIDFASFGTPVKARSTATCGDSRAESSKDRARRRNTICCGAGFLLNSEMSSLSDDFKPNFSVYAHPRDPSNHSSVDSETHNLNTSVLQNKILNNPSRTSNSKIRIVTPTESPTRSSMTRRLTQDIAALYSSNSNQDNRAARRFHRQRESASSPTKKGKEKRNSAPPILAFASTRGDGHQRTSLIGSNEVPVDNSNRLTSSTDTIFAIPNPQSSPPLLPAIAADFNQHNDNNSKNQRIRAHSSSSSGPYANRLFELGLSPIIEDPQVFSERPLMCAARSVAAPNELSLEDSSGSSYGQLLEERAIDYFSLSTFGDFGGLEWSKVESRINEEVTGGQYETQNFGEDAHLEEGRERRPFYNDMHALEDSMMLIPELTLTAPTPELGCSVELLPRGLLDDSGRDYQGHITTCAAAPGVPNELDFVTPLVDARRSNVLGTGTDLFVDPLGKGHRRRSFLGKKLDGILARRLLSRSGDDDILSGDMVGVPGRKAEMRTFGNRFGWLARRDDIYKGRTAASADTKAESTGRNWKKRLSQILEDVTGPSSGHDTSVSGFEQANGSPRIGKLVDTYTTIPPAQERPPSWGSFGNHLGSGRNLLEEHCSGSSLLEATTRVHEEGEHAASRLFGTPNTGIRAKTTSSPRNWYGGASGETSREDDAKLEKPRRHSFGIDLQSLRFGGRWRARGATEEAKLDQVGVRETGNGSRWAARRSVAF